MPGQIFDSGGQQYSMSDDAGLASTIDDIPDLPSSRLVGPQVVSALGQDSAPAMWPGSIVWGMGVTKLRVVKVRSFNFTHVWYKDNLSQEDIFANHVISMAVRRLRFGVQVRNFEFVRTWNGIGGIVYIPSFPQLERKETAWPHAT